MKSLSKPTLFSWKSAFSLTGFFALISMPVLSLSFGIIWDEWIQSHYGKLVLQFLLTLGQDRSALSFGETMYLYGGLFDVLTAGIYGLIFGSLSQVAQAPLQADLVLPHWHTVRHIVNSLFGFTAIFFTALTAKKIGGWRAGTLTWLLLLLSPRFLGNAMNNPKDIPFAAAAAIFVYFLTDLLQTFPLTKKRTLAGLAFGIALAMNIRAGGILFLFYAWLFCGRAWLQSRSHASASKLSAWLKILIPVSIAGYFGGILFWPYGWLDPITHPIKALTEFSKFSGAQGTLLFEGLLYSHGQTPWYYLPKWILISSPLFFTAGIALFSFLSKKIFTRYPAILLQLLLFCFFFPLVYAIFTRSVVYDSWRHFFFIYPPAILLTALAWNELWESAGSSTQKAGLILFFVFLLCEPLGWMLKNHPNQIAYFSPLAGGVQGARGRYETDYWGNCLRQASEGFLEEYKKSHAPAPVVIRTEGEFISSAPFLGRGLGAYFIPHSPGQNEWQYSIELTRGKDPQSLRDGSWPGPHAVYVVQADQVPLCAVIEKK